MMNSTELSSAIEQVIGQLQSVYSDHATESDLYEAALFCLALRASEQAGGTALITDDGAAPVLEARFRRSPGNLWLGGFTYARVAFPAHGRELEIHLGVYVLGASGVAHECDVALLDHMEAQRSRAGAVHPRRRGLVGAIEAKYYAASPGISVGRGFIGLASEMGQRKSVLAFPATASASVATLLARKPSECFDDLIPASQAAGRLTAHLEQAIRNWLA